MGRTLVSSDTYFLQDCLALIHQKGNDMIQPQPTALYSSMLLTQQFPTSGLNPN